MDKYVVLYWVNGEFEVEEFNDKEKAYHEYFYNKHAYSLAKVLEEAPSEQLPPEAENEQIN